MAAAAPCCRRRQTHRDHMKRFAEWALYAIGLLAVSYLALYLYAVLTQPNFVPGDPIRIFRKPDAPNYSVRPGTMDSA
jgi:hypothetical protein